MRKKRMQGGGISNTKAWWTWHFMKQRVLNSTDKDYPLYKDRSIDPRWMVFANFHADMGDRPEGLTLDRIDNSKGYFKENCRWATRSQQASNRTKGDYSRKLTMEKAREIKVALSEKALVRELAVKYGVSTSAITNIKCGRRWGHV